MTQVENASRSQTMKRAAFAYTLLTSGFWHLLIFATYPPGSGPDGHLYALTAGQLFQWPPLDIYQLMDRNGYFPFLIRIFWDMSAGLSMLVFLMHLLLLLWAVWTVALLNKYFSAWHGWTMAIALSLFPHLAVIAQVTNSELAVAVTLWPACITAMAFILKHKETKEWSFPLLAGACLFFGLTITARPSGLALFAVFVCCWLFRKVPLQMLAKAGALFLLAFLWVPTYNYCTLGYFGLEKKTGRVFFQTAYLSKHFSPENGPNSQKIADLLIAKWPELLQTNEVIKRNNEDIQVLLANNDMPWHLYYLVVSLLRQNYPPSEVNELLLQAGIEWLKREPEIFFRDRLQKAYTQLRYGVTNQLDFTPSSQLKTQEDAAYASSPENRYRGASVLTKEMNMLQTEKQYQQHLRLFDEVVERYTSGLRNDSLLTIYATLYKHIPTFQWIHIFGLLVIASIVLLLKAAYTQDWALATIVLGVSSYTYGNLVFIMLVSSGSGLHFLPSLPLALLVISIVIGTVLSKLFDYIELKRL